MSKHKTRELEGKLLDAAVAIAEVVAVEDINAGLMRWDRPDGVWRGWNPSTDWRDGGPIIERERIRMIVGSDEGYEDWWIAYIITDKGVETAQQSGNTPLQAAMRAYVFQKFGEEVELP